jgi:hydrogenase expression/formation protein HypE
MLTNLPVGKLPPELLKQLLAQIPIKDPRIVLGPGIGLDCAVLDLGTTLLVLKSDPITFSTDEIGWYAVQINANDIATTGALPRWFMTTLLLPEDHTTPEMVAEIHRELNKACQQINVSIIGGHTEITFGLDRPVLVGTMIGEVDHQNLVTPCGASQGDRILLTKGVPIEATAILAREFTEHLLTHLSPEEIEQAIAFLHCPGISILKDTQIALKAGKVTAMHDPTEGGLSSAMWELAQASKCCLTIDPNEVYIPPLSKRICQIFNLDPLAAIASGALLLTAPAHHAGKISRALESEGIPCQEIGVVEAGPPTVLQIIGSDRQILPLPARDEIARLFEQ